MFLLLSKTQKWFVLKTVAFVGLLDARLRLFTVNFRVFELENQVKKRLD